MKLVAYLTAVVVAAATLTTAAAAAPSAGAAVAVQGPAPARAAPATAPQPQHRERSTAEKLRDGRHAVVYFRGKAWSVQRRIPVPLTPTNYAERHTTSPAFLHWSKHRWNVIWHRAKHRLGAHRLPFTNDWQTAVRIVQRTWPGTASFELSCSAHEGGHGPFVMNYEGSGAGGWMQYMEGTWSSHFYSAIALARQEHLPLPPAQAWSWTSPLGQAFAAGWGYSYQRSAWTGDPYC